MRAAIAALLVLVAAGAGHAAYSGLTIIPTAETLPAGHVCVDYQVVTPTAVGSGVDAAFLNTQSGVGSRAEIGMDLDFTREAEAGAVFNGKLALLPLDTGLGVAVGLYNIGEGARPVSYLAVTRPLSDRLQLHAGAQRTPDRETQGFAGVDYAVTERLSVYGEYLAGRENAAAGTLYYQLSEPWGVSVAFQRANDGEAGDSLVFSIGCLRAPM